MRLKHGVWFLVLGIILFLSLPKNAFAAKTCSLSLNSTNITSGNQITVSYSGTDSTGSQATDLLLTRWPDGDQVSPAPIGTTEISYLSNKYYKLATCAANQNCQAQTPTDLPPGKYYAFCQVFASTDACSGNPFCANSGVGGHIQCANEHISASCSASDHVFFDVKPAPATASTITANDIPAALPLSFTAQGNRQTASLGGTWYIKPDRDSVAFQTVTVPNFWRRWSINSAWFTKSTFTDVFRSDPTILNQMQNPYSSWPGTVWYATKFTIPSTFQGKSVRVHFGAVSANAEVFINGVLVGTHLGMHDPFELELGSHILYGQTNILTVRVTDSSPYESPVRTIATPGGAFREEGGIWLPVELTITDPAYLGIVQVITPATNSLSFTVNLTNSSATNNSYSITAQIADATSGQVINSTDFPPQSVNSLQTFSYSGSMNNLSGINPWSPEFPNLYSLTLFLKTNSTTIDQTSKTIGFRTFTVSSDGTKFLLNGRPYFLKGVADTYLYGVSNLDPTYIHTYIKTMKDAGANAVRLHIAPNSSVYDEFDKQGLLVMTEFTSVGDGTINSSSTMFQQEQNEVANWIKNFSYHPSIAFYSLNNEQILFSPGGTYGDSLRLLYDTLIPYLRTNVDGTRPYLSDAGCMGAQTFQNNTYTPPAGSNLTDICGQQTNMTDAHWYYEWYRYNPTNPFNFDSGTIPVTATASATHPNDFSNSLDTMFSYRPTIPKPQIFSEFGGVYSDDQGDFYPYVNGDDVFGKPTSESGASIDAIGTSPNLPNDALNYAAKVVSDTVNTLLSKRATTRLGGFFFFGYPNLFYNANNFPWDKLKSWYISAYSNPCVSGLNCITSSTWRDHSTLEPKPGYTTLKGIYTNTSAYSNLTCTISIASPIVTAGTSTTVTFSSQGDVGQTVDAYLVSWPNGSTISPPPSTNVSTSFGVTYYKMGSCTPDGRNCSFTTPTNLPSGNYYVNCNAILSKMGLGACSGNPFCSYENVGGTLNCSNIGFSSCSTNDKAPLQVNLAGDINNSGNVDSTDIKLVLNNWLGTGSCSGNNCDLNTDAKINNLDEAFVISAFKSLPNPTMVSSPGPSATPMVSPRATPFPTPSPSPTNLHIGAGSYQYIDGGGVPRLVLQFIKSDGLTVETGRCNMSTGAQSWGVGGTNCDSYTISSLSGIDTANPSATFTSLSYYQFTFNTINYEYQQLIENDGVTVLSRKCILSPSAVLGLSTCDSAFTKSSLAGIDGINTFKTLTYYPFTSGSTQYMGQQLIEADGVTTLIRKCGLSSSSNIGLSSCDQTFTKSSLSGLGGAPNGFTGWTEYPFTFNGTSYLSQLFIETDKMNVLTRSCNWDASQSFGVSSCSLIQTGNIHSFWPLFSF